MKWLKSFITQNIFFSIFFTMILAMALTTQACGQGASDSEKIPENPTWENSVREIFNNHCNLCHGETPNRGAPNYFRLDVYPDQEGFLGAFHMAKESLEQIEEGGMPPGGGMGDNDKAIIRLWVENGAPETGSDNGTPNQRECIPGFENADPDYQSPGEKEKEGQMYPGANCLSCHMQGGPAVDDDDNDEDDSDDKDDDDGEKDDDDDDEKIFTFAGTVFVDPEGSVPASGVTVQMTDARGEVLTLITNSAGNFYTTQKMTFPISALLRKGEREVVMQSLQNSGGCNQCHSCNGEVGDKLFLP